MTISKSPNRTIRGIRDSIPSGYVLGRTDTGDGATHLISMKELAQQTGTSKGGGISSVSLSLDTGLYTVGGSPGSDLVGTLDNQAANKVFAGPATGSAAKPAFRSLVAADLPLATGSAFGAVKPDGTSITITGGVISAAGYTLPTATTTVLGGVKVDGTTITIASGVISAAGYTLPTASTTVLGGVKVDGTSITINTGVIGAAYVILGTGVPTALKPAGTLYSRTDAAGLYVSTSTVSGGKTVVQTAYDIHGNSTPGNITLPGAPTVGHLIIVFVHWGEANMAAPTINTSAWTQFITVTSGSNEPCFAVYRYVQTGDTAVLPAICTAGTAYWGATAFEISGVSGTFATDVEASSGTFGNVSSITAPSITTASTGTLALLAGGQYNGNTNPTLGGSGTWTTDQSAHNAMNFGSVACGHQTVSASGTAVAGTVTFGASDAGTSVMQCILSGGSGSVVTGWTLIGP